MVSNPMANEQIHQTNEDKLERYVERMTALQNDLKSIQKDLNLVTEDAKLNGFDLQALNFLVRVRMQNSNDMGRRVLTNLAEYAHLTGTPLEVVVERESPSSEPPRSFLPESIEPLEEKKLLSSSRLFIKASWGVFIAISLLWLLT